MSEPLALALRRVLGMPAMYVCGVQYEPDGRKVTHAWVEVGPIIIDITADQFAGQLPVLVTTDRTWHNTWLDQEPRPPADPDANPVWWATNGEPIYRVGTGSGA